jgi:methylphosphotriester-DNA--protein-cysteine methyltransferase
MATIILRRPGPALERFVDRLWYFDTNDTTPQPDRVLPHGTFELVISLNPDANGAADESLIAGPHTRAMIVDPVDYTPMIGAHFRPGAAAMLLGYPAHDFRDLDVSLADIWTSQAVELRECLIETCNPDEALSTLELALIGIARSAALLHPAVSMAISRLHAPYLVTSIRDLASDCGLSQRRFIELFKHQVGLTPKLYSRIRRFQRTLSVIQRSERPCWAGLAFDCGYADQAHLIRDFHDLSGLRPTEYLPRWPDHPNHVPLP